MRKLLGAFLLILIMLGYGCVKPNPEVNEQAQEIKETEVQDRPTIDAKEQNISVPEGESAKPQDEQAIGEERKPQEEPELWQAGELTIPGNFADSDVVELSDGTYRIYYGIEPEVPGNNLEIYSAISSDGKSWRQEEGARRTQSVFPDVVKLPDGKWRMYFQQQQVIKSAISSDGLRWADESGTRIDASNSFGLKFENVVAPTTIQLDDGTYMVVYSGRIKERYDVDGAKVPNNDMRVLVWATSSDGLLWNKQGIALDARNPVLEGFADGPELVRWDDGIIRLYFWGYRGIYYSTFESGQFTEPKIAIEPANPQNFLYPSDPPGDPTLIKIGNTWHMYYGIWKKGIFYTTLE